MRSLLKYCIDGAEISLFLHRIEDHCCFLAWKISPRLRSYAQACWGYERHLAKHLGGYLGDCVCAMSKNDQLKSKMWGIPGAVLLAGTSGLMYLWILDLKTDTHWFLRINLRLLLICWMSCLNSLVWSCMNLHSLPTREESLKNLCLCEGSCEDCSLPSWNKWKGWEKTQGNFYVVRLDDCDPLAIAELRHIDWYNVFQFEALTEARELLLNSNQGMGAKIWIPFWAFHCSSSGWRIHGQMCEPGYQETCLHSLEWSERLQET
jgi:hypothetical protein